MVVGLSLPSDGIERQHHATLVTAMTLYGLMVNFLVFNEIVE